MNEPFFDRLNYSTANEDWRTEQQALCVGPGARVLCVTGSGARPLDMLVHDPQSVVAVDLNPAQGYLFELKRAAMRALDYDSFLGFVGHWPSSQRGQVFEQIRAQLSEDASAYWSRHIATVRRGVLYQGAWERHCRWLSVATHILRGRAVDQLFSCQTILEQRDFARDVWDRSWWRLCFDVLGSRTAFRWLLRDPGFYLHAQPAEGLGRFMYNALLASLGRHLARDNFMLSMVFRGRLSDTDLPPYLHRDTFDIVHDRLDRITLQTASVTDYLNRGEPGRFTHYSLSDIPSFLDQAGFEALLRAMRRGAAPDARFCSRRFLADQAIPADLVDQLPRDAALETTLAAEDRACIYAFVVGNVLRTAAA